MTVASKVARGPGDLALQDVTAETRRRIEKTRMRRTLRRGAKLWSRGDTCEHVTIVEEGLVRVGRAGPDGNFSVLGLFGPGDAVGLAAALEPTTRYPADAAVVSASARISRVSASEVRSAMASDPALAAELQRALLHHTRVILAKISVTGAGSVRARLATLFMQLADRFGVEREADGRTTLALALTRVTLAGFVEARVETVIRTLSSWRRDDVLRSADGCLVLDYAALAAIAAAG